MKEREREKRGERGEIIKPAVFISLKNGNPERIWGRFIILATATGVLLMKDNFFSGCLKKATRFLKNLLSGDTSGEKEAGHLEAPLPHSKKKKGGVLNLKSI